MGQAGAGQQDRWSQRCCLGGLRAPPAEQPGGGGGASLCKGRKHKGVGVHGGGGPLWPGRPLAGPEGGVVAVLQVVGVAAHLRQSRVGGKQRGGGGSVQGDGARSIQQRPAHPAGVAPQTTAGENSHARWPSAAAAPHRLPKTVCAVGRGLRNPHFTMQTRPCPAQAIGGWALEGRATRQG